jgi:hypothetical protein
VVTLAQIPLTCCFHCATVSGPDCDALVKVVEVDVVAAVDVVDAGAWALEVVLELLLLPQPASSAATAATAISAWVLLIRSPPVSALA